MACLGHLLSTAITSDPWSWGDLYTIEVTSGNLRQSDSVVGKILEVELLISLPSHNTRKFSGQTGVSGQCNWNDIGYTVVPLLVATLNRGHPL